MDSLLEITLMAVGPLAEVLLQVVGRVAMKVRYLSRVRCAYHCKTLKVRTAYTLLGVYGFHRQERKLILHDC